MYILSILLTVLVDHQMPYILQNIDSSILNFMTIMSVQMKKILTYRGTNKQGYKTYKTKTKDCLNCPFKEQCTNQKTKVILRHFL